MLRNLCISFALVVMAPGSSLPYTASGEAIEWQTNFDKALNMAKETGKPMLMDFWADWCPPCKAMDREVWPEARIASLSRRFICVSVDVDRDASAARRYRVSPIPTIILADSWGNPIIRHEGYLHASSLARMMDGFPSNFSEINQWNAILERDSKNLGALRNIGEFYRKIGALDLSNRYFKDALKTKEAKANDGLREELLMLVGVNHFKLGQFGDARKSFEQCLKEFPNGSQCDKALLGLVTVQVKQGKMNDAEKTFEQLKGKYPDSSATRQAAENLKLSQKRE